ncbi:MAG: hypothetical protein DLM54_08540 [Acidimicrobiales bacterium]|nr:MAG: hypothetical protein DLM54_08540 [Acidimicrobiales bacterium]
MGGSVLKRLAGQPRAPLVGLAVVSVASLITRVAWLGTPGQAVVGDEINYVNVARTILRLPLPPGTPTFYTYQGGFDVNTVHPPLAKLLIAASMRIFGDNPIGWRLPSLVFASAALLALYWLVRSAGGSSWLALGATSVLAVDNLFIVYGRTATIEMFPLVFMLAGTALYLRRRPIAAGVVIGIGTLTKEVGVFPLLVLVVLEVLRLALPPSTTGEPRSRNWMKPARALAVCSVVTVVTYLGLLGGLDAKFSTFRNPVSHTEFMIGFHQKYVPHVAPPPRSGAGYILVQPSKPWQWLINEIPLPLYYYPAPLQDARIRFLGEMNPIIIGFALVGFLWAVYTAGVRRDQISFLILAWSLGTFVPFLLVSTKVGYLYYIIVVLPGLCLAVARLLGSSIVPRPLLAICCMPVAYYAWYLYPFRLG